MRTFLFWMSLLPFFFLIFLVPIWHLNQYQKEEQLLAVEYEKLVEEVYVFRQEILPIAVEFIIEKNKTLSFDEKKHMMLRVKMLGSHQEAIDQLAFQGEIRREADCSEIYESICEIRKIESFPRFLSREGLEKSKKRFNEIKKFFDHFLLKKQEGADPKDRPLLFLPKKLDK